MQMKQSGNLFRTTKLKNKTNAIAFVEKMLFISKNS